MNRVTRKSFHSSVGIEGSDSEVIADGSNRYVRASLKERWAIRIRNRHVVHCDPGRPGFLPEFDHLRRSADGVGKPVLSPDSRHTAYGALRNGKKVLVVNDEERGPEYDGIRQVVFDGNDRLNLIGLRGDSLFAVSVIGF